MTTLRRILAAACALAAAALMGGCASLPPPPAPQPPTHAIEDGARTFLGKMAAKGAPATKDGSAPLSGFRLMPEAAFAFDARIALARNAEKSLDVQYYLIEKDDVGLLLLKELREAAERGVRVRLLVDDLYAGGEDELFNTFAAFPNVEVRLFNPLPSRASALPVRLALSLHDFKRINHRMHNKLMVADNSFAISGGRNIANDYFMRSTAANFIDLDVVSSGPVVHELSNAFDMYWNSEFVWPIQSVAPMSMTSETARRRFDEIVRAAVPDVPLRARDVLGNSPLGEELVTGRIERHWATSKVFADSPAKITRKPEDAYRGSVTEGALGVISTAKTKVVIASPYFIPGPIGMAMMKEQIGNGVNVTVVTNSLGSTDEPLAYAGYERYRADMLKIGVTIYEIAPQYSARSKRFGEFGKSISRLHAKLANIDGKRFFVGSMNLDHRSAAVNTELGLVIDNDLLVAEYTDYVRGTGADGEDDLGYRLRLTPDGRRTEWLEYNDQGGDIVHADVPGEFLWLRFKSWLLLPVVGEDLL
ncbi:MAG: phospholipase D family protein [Comamonadaceae bacterium]|nr:MAG: phospholipase D family protein [Comamonadaceae bacterium]